MVTYFIENLPTIIVLLGLFDAAVLLLLGIIASVLILTPFKAAYFWDKAGAAIAIFVCTSVAACIVLVVTRWVAGFFLTEPLIP